MKSKEHLHFMLHKPYGVLSQFVSNDPKEQKKNFLGALYPFPEGTMAIGRLDEKSEGLLLLTTSGKLSDHITGASIEKEYYVQVDGLITDMAIKQLQNGVKIGIHGKRYLTKPCKVVGLSSLPDFPPRSKKIRDDRHGPTSWISITLTEGKYKQIRKMTAAVGHPTLRLVRVRVGGLRLDDLKNAEVRAISDTQIDELIG